MTERVKCRRCGASILPQTAKRHHGCCAHCGKIPWTSYIGTQVLGKLGQWLDPFMRRILRTPEPDGSLYRDLAVLLAFSETELCRIQQDKYPENVFDDLLEKRRLGATTDVHAEAEEILRSHRTCLPHPLHTSWSLIEADIHAMEEQPAEKVLEVVCGHLWKEASVPLLLETGHDYFTTVFVPRQLLSHFITRIERSNIAGLFFPTQAQR